MIHNWSEKTHQQIFPDVHELGDWKHSCKTTCLLRNCTLRTAASSGSYGPHEQSGANRQFQLWQEGRRHQRCYIPHKQHRPAGTPVALVRKLIPLLFSSLSHSKSTDKTADDNQNLLVLQFVSSWEKGFPGKHSSVSTDMQTYPRPKCILPSHLAFIQPGRCSYYSNDTSHLKTVVKK